MHNGTSQCCLFELLPYTQQVGVPCGTVVLAEALRTGTQVSHLVTLWHLSPAHTCSPTTTPPYRHTLEFLWVTRLDCHTSAQLAGK